MDAAVHWYGYALPKNPEAFATREFDATPFMHANFQLHEKYIVALSVCHMEGALGVDGDLEDALFIRRHIIELCGSSIEVEVGNVATDSPGAARGVIGFKLWEAKLP